MPQHADQITVASKPRAAALEAEGSVSTDDEESSSQGCEPTPLRVALAQELQMPSVA